MFTLLQARSGCHQLEGRTSHPLRRHLAIGLGRPDVGGCADAVGADVGVADVLAAGALVLDFLSHILRGSPMALDLPA